MSFFIVLYLPSQKKAEAPPKRMSGTNVLQSRIEAVSGTKTKKALALTPFSPKRLLRGCKLYFLDKLASVGGISRALDACMDSSSILILNNLTFSNIAGTAKETGGKYKLISFLRSFRVLLRGIFATDSMLDLTRRIKLWFQERLQMILV